MRTLIATIPVFVICVSALPSADDSLKPDAVREAVEKALPLILKEHGAIPISRDCLSCHHQALPGLALFSVKNA